MEEDEWDMKRREIMPKSPSEEGWAMSLISKVRIKIFRIFAINPFA